MSPHVAIIPVGSLDQDLVEALLTGLSGPLPWPVRMHPGLLPDADFAWSPGRRQHHSTSILGRIVDSPPKDAVRVLAVGDLDLFIPILTFVFGEAMLDGPAACVGLTRLRQEFYGLPPDRALLRERLVKEALHEIGHTCSLVHCRLSTCVMSASSSVESVDLKSARFCGDCAAGVKSAEFLNGCR